MTTSELQAVFTKLHNCDADYVETVPVVEEFQGEMIFQGDVEVFDIRGHPKATRGYGWGYVTTEGGGRRYFTVLELLPVDSPQTQSKQRSCRRLRMREKRKKVGRPPLAKGEAKAIVLQSRVQPAEKAAYQRAA